MHNLQVTFVDIHAHILPGLTHGPANLEKAVELAKLAEKDGVGILAATPHLNIEQPLNWPQVQTIFKNLRQRLKEAGVKIKLFLGAEVLMSAGLIEQVKEAGFPLFGGDVKYVLVEFPPENIPFYALELLFDLQLEEIRPVLAHPERNLAICREPSLLKEFVERGCLTQINCSSLVGKAGKEAKRCSHKLVTSGLAHLVASDAHSSSAIGLARLPLRPARHYEAQAGGGTSGQACPPSQSSGFGRRASGGLGAGFGGRYFYFQQAFEILKKVVGEAEAVNMTKKRPRYILEGVPIISED